MTMTATSTRLIFQYWDHLRGDRAAPERGEIEPGAVRHALLDTFILENGVDGLRFRLAGTRLSALFGGELRETLFATLWPEATTRSELGRMAEAVMDDSAGAIAGLRLATARGDSDDFELVILPLRHQGRTHARLLGALAPIHAPLWLGLLPVVTSEVRSMRIIWGGEKAEAGDDPAARRARFTLLQGGRR